MQQLHRFTPGVRRFVCKRTFACVALAIGSTFTAGAVDGGVDGDTARETTTNVASEDVPAVRRFDGAVEVDPVSGGDGAASSIRIVSASKCFLLIKDEAAVPARDRGVLSELLVRPGTLVKAGEVLGRLDDVEAVLNVEAATLDLATAEKELADSVATEIAEASLAEIEAALELARMERTIAKTVAEADVAVRIAKNAAKLAQEELDRGLKARAAFKSAVSDLELMKFQIARDEKVLQVENAVHEETVEDLQSRSREVAVTQQEKAVERLRLELLETKNELQLAQLGIERLKKTVALAEEQLSRREIRSPLNGLIVEKQRHPGEWVEPGDAVLRVVRLDRLLVEGYVSAAEVDQSTVGSSVELTVRHGEATIETTGTVVFVSPEVDRVNREVAVRAEIENADFRLRPGQQASMVIHCLDQK